MADNKTVAQEDPVLGLDGTELVRVVQGGASARANADQWPKIRLAADWFDDVNGNFSGTIDTTTAPYNSQSTPGQSTICADPDTAADSGIWVLGTHADPAAVPVTRRSDSVVGSVFRVGELIYRFDVNNQDNNRVCLAYEIYNGTVDVAAAALDGVNVSVYWRLITEHIGPLGSLVVTGAISAGSINTGDGPISGLIIGSVDYGTENEDTSFTANAPQVHFIDATSGNITATLPDAFAEQPYSSYSFAKTLKRIDNSGNTVTVAVLSGWYLEGVLNGTLLLAPLESAEFYARSANEWWRI